MGHKDLAEFAAHMREHEFDYLRTEMARRDLQPFPAYYIDTETGVIGDPTNLVFLDFVPTGMDEEADSVITNYGKDHGTPLDRLL